jgi:beta-glucosidase-like glycosyl hydrolase/CubicO group peptidase (beta-lactamase class C family)
MKKVALIFTLLLLISCDIVFATNPPFLKAQPQWADSMLSKMTLDEKIGQLIMVTSNAWLKEKQQQTLLEQVEKFNVGGVLFLKSTPFDLATRANECQQRSKIPLFIALDGENGLSFRMDSTIVYPNMIALGAITSDSLLYRMGREIGQQCRTLGINLNFAPVADVNSNPENPVINYRSFGENPLRVAQKCLQLAKGMQDENIMVSVKHFPGHGNTSKDSHETLPAVDEDYQQLDSVDFLPFKMCIDNGINGIMTAHIQVPEIDKSKRPATLSKKIMTTILRDSLRFEGLIFSDAMNMKGITSRFNEGEAAVQAFKAGVDVLEFVQHPDRVITAVKSAIQQGALKESVINEKCRKVLIAKSWMDINNHKQTQTNLIKEQLNKPEYQLTARQLTEQSLTVINNERSILPLQRLDTLKIASVSIGAKEMTPFQRGLERYTMVDHFNLPSDASPDELIAILPVLKNYNIIIAAIHGTKMLPSKRYNITDIQLAAIDSLCRREKVILTFFTNPYSLAFFKGSEKAEATIVAYSETESAQDLTSQLIFGAIGANATLPVTVDGKYKAGFGIQVKESQRLKFTLPEEAGFDSHTLNSTIDSFATSAIQSKIFPGCQVLVAQHGKVIFQKSYGYFTYDTIEKVTNASLYDWASITKITGPIPLIMKLYQDSLLKLDAPFSNYWTDFKRSNKSKITLRDILTHQAQLKPGISYHVKLMKEEKKHKGTVFSETPSSLFPVRISSHLYTREESKQRMFDEIRDSDLLKEKKYTYSDLGFYLFPDLISKLTGENYEELLNRTFYKPLGAVTVGYNPVNHFPLKQVAPTERDDLFRKEQLQGFVHDEGAAIMGGISGNAGLFGSSLDMAKIMQCYLQKGHYGDLSLIDEKTLQEFTRVQFPENNNRRALGFDKPYLNNKSLSAANAYPAPDASSGSFGHSGFTGTFTWVDPDNQLLFIFLTNRIYPTREYTKLIDSNFRPRLYQAIIDCRHSFIRKPY